MDGLNPITRREVFLAAASGEQIETPEPITREEMYLKKIAEGGGGSDLPDTPAEDGTYALQNTVSSGTSTLSWASGGSSGGVLMVTDTDGTLDKTAGEIMSAYTNGVVVVNIESDGYIDRAIIVDAHYYPDETNHYNFGVYMGSYGTYSAENSTDYPIMEA